MFSKTVKEIRELSKMLSLYLDEVDEDSLLLEGSTVSLVESKV